MALITSGQPPTPLGRVGQVVPNFFAPSARKHTSNEEKVALITFCCIKSKISINHSGIVTRRRRKMLDLVLEIIHFCCRNEGFDADFWFNLSNFRRRRREKWHLLLQALRILFLSLESGTYYTSYVRDFWFYFWKVALTTQSYRFYFWKGHLLDQSYIRNYSIFGKWHLLHQSYIRDFWFDFG